LVIVIVVVVVALLGLGLGVVVVVPVVGVVVAVLQVIGLILLLIVGLEQLVLRHVLSIGEGMRVGGFVVAGGVDLDLLLLVLFLTAEVIVGAPDGRTHVVEFLVLVIPWRIIVAYGVGASVFALADGLPAPDSGRFLPHHLSEVAIGWVDIRSLKVVNLPLIIPQLERKPTVDGLLRVPRQVLSIWKIVRVIKVGAVFDG